MKIAPVSSSYVEELDDPFLRLWPHRFNYIYASHPAPNRKPEWHTESRHPLSDRLILQGSGLFGVRFGSETRYILLDIDCDSAYHPSRDPFAISRIMEALEPLGLTRYIACTSSYSGGLHIYFPFAEAQKSWEIALAVATLIENAGCKIAPGTLELFPNPRQFNVKGTQSLFNAHRLPLQAGSYLVNTAWEPVWSSKEQYVKAWEMAVAQNTITHKSVTRIIKAARRRNYVITKKAEKFLNDLNAEIEIGWTGPGQTNRLLGRIAMRSYVFGHILGASHPLTGEDLVRDIVRVAKELPGFTEWCNHQHELEKKAREWARSVEGSTRYYHYGRDKKESIAQELNTPTWNEQQEVAARDKIRMAIATLLEEGRLPIRVGERFFILTKEFQIGGSTLYRHKDLWHPAHLRDITPVENPPVPPDEKAPSWVDHSPVPTQEGHTSLLGVNGGKNTTDKHLSPLEQELYQEVGGKSSSVTPPDTVQEAIAREQQQKRNRRQLDRDEQIIFFLDSGDSILIKEAFLMLGWDIDTCGGDGPAPAPP